MRQLVYVMRFTGQASPVGLNGGVLVVKATATRPMHVTFGREDPASPLTVISAGKAVLDAEMTLTGATSFQAVGTIAFDTGNRLWGGTVGSGYLGASADPLLRHGAVVRGIDGGSGRFAEATGLIASNFIVDDDGEFTDYHLGVIFIP
jgi:hypothetical protein